MLSYNVILATAIFCLAHVVAGIDLESSKERSCIPTPTAIQVNTNFWNTIVRNYYTLMSRHDLYLTAMDILQKPASEINEGELYYDGQIVFDYQVNNGSFFARGFHGHAVEYVLTELSPGVYDFRPRPGTIYSYAGTVYTIMTDNLTYTLFVFCSDQNQATWFVNSSIAKLSDETRQAIFKRVKELGFSEEYFTENRYGTLF